MRLLWATFSSSSLTHQTTEALAYFPLTPKPFLIITHTHIVTSMTDYDDEIEEVELYQSSRERQAYDDQATLYAIILATEHLERAYARDAVTQQEYVAECNKLISQFKMAEKAALLNVNMTTETFMQVYQMDCPRAVERLLNMGVPEPIRSGETTDVAVTVAETVQHFITAMDAVKLESRFVDELQPLLSDLMDSLTRLLFCAKS